MPIPFQFDALKKRHTDARNWAKEVTESNRCAFVMGVALNLRPSPHEINFRGQPFAHSFIRDQKFLEKFFVKAEELAFNITKNFGRPDIVAPGKDALKLIVGVQGVVYCRNCWRTPKEKLMLRDKGSGDHIDLWNGNYIEIYGAAGTKLIQDAEKILLWKTK